MGDDSGDDEKGEQEIPRITLHGVVDKIVPSNHPVNQRRLRSSYKRRRSCTKKFVSRTYSTMVMARK